MKHLMRAFVGGEISPALWGRVDHTRYLTGLQSCRNFWILPQGPAQNRPGFQFVSRCQRQGLKSRLIPFRFSADQTMVLEFAHQRLRFHSQGGTLMKPSTQPLEPPTPYQLETPYRAAHLFELHTAQSNDVLTIVHPQYPPMALQRLGAHQWTLAPIDFESPLSPPKDLRLHKHDPNSTEADQAHRAEQRYCVTAFSAKILAESHPSAVVTTHNNLSHTGWSNRLQWSAVSGATHYRLYKYQSGVFGFLGQTAELAFTDNHIHADVQYTPPCHDNPFQGPQHYPGAVSYYEQRRCFAGTHAAPDQLWMTRVGTESNLSTSMPAQPPDAIHVRLVAQERQTIQHVVPFSRLMVFTTQAVWAIEAVEGQALTQSTFRAKPQAYGGANAVQPVVIGHHVLYAPPQGQRLQALSYQLQADGWVSQEVSWMADHLLAGDPIVSLAYSASPFPVVWVVTAQGQLLGLTYLPEQEVIAWHRHETYNGQFESCCVVSEDGEDTLYVTIKRQIQGKTRRTIERLAPRTFQNPEDACFVDSGLTYRSDAAAYVFSGLDHLEGETVSILADGAVLPPRTVQQGTITLDTPAKIVHIGLPIVAELQTLPLEVQGRAKNLRKVKLRVQNTAGLLAGPRFDRLSAYKACYTTYGQPPRWLSTDIDITLQTTWQADGSLCIQQTDPLPVTLLSLWLEGQVSA